MVNMVDFILCIFATIKRCELQFLSECDPYYALFREPLSVNIIPAVPVLKKIEKNVNTIKLLPLNIFLVCCGQNKT